MGAVFQTMSASFPKAFASPQKKRRKPATYLARVSTSLTSLQNPLPTHTRTCLTILVCSFFARWLSETPRFTMRHTRMQINFQLAIIVPNALEPVYLRKQLRLMARYRCLMGKLLRIKIKRLKENTMNI